MKHLIAALLLTVAMPALGGDRPSAEPLDLQDRAALEAALARDEAVARVATGDACYAALCRASAYAFALAEPGGEGAGDLARRGFELADRARKLDGSRVEAHYRYALALGVYLRENNLAGITRTADLIDAARRAAAIDERYDRGGPHRLLAILYAEAPRLLGPGDHDKARKHLDRLMAIAGDQLENRLVSVRVLAAIGEEEQARRVLATIDPETGRDETERRDGRATKARLARALDD